MLIIKSNNGYFTFIYIYNIFIYTINIYEFPTLPIINFL
jgi:hypothetical protein